MRKRFQITFELMFPDDYIEMSPEELKSGIINALSASYEMTISEEDTIQIKEIPLCGS